MQNFLLGEHARGPPPRGTLKSSELFTKMRVLLIHLMFTEAPHTTLQTQITRLSKQVWPRHSCNARWICGVNCYLRCCHLLRCFIRWWKGWMAPLFSSNLSSCYAITIKIRILRGGLILSFVLSVLTKQFNVLNLHNCCWYGSVRGNIKVNITKTKSDGFLFMSSVM